MPKISELPAGEVVNALDEIPANQQGTTRKLTRQQIVAGIVNADIDAAAAIALSKLATDPLARANHTGTQTLATISDSGALAALDEVGTTQIADDAVTAPKAAPNLGIYNTIFDANDYSSTPFELPDAWMQRREFTGAQDHIIEINEGLSTNPAAYGMFRAPPNNTLSIRRVADTGVQINGVSDNAFVWTVPAGGYVAWFVIDDNHVFLVGDNTFTQVATADLDMDNNDILNIGAESTFETPASTLTALGGLPLAGGTMSGAIDMADNNLTAPRLIDTAEVAPAATGINGAVTRDFTLGQIQELTLSGDVTSLAISNPPATGNAGAITFIIHTATFDWAHPTGIEWPGGVAPTMTANGTDIITYITRDGGTTWYGFEGGLDFS